MKISAHSVFVNLDDDGDYPVSVYFHDDDLDYCFSLSRHNYPGIDDGQIEVMLRDQIHAETNNLAVELDPRGLVANWSAETAARLLGVDRMTIDFGAGLDELESVRAALADMFRDLPGFSDRCGDSPDTPPIE